MSKYFGEFLVEKGVITKDNLVDALVEQVSTTPPLCQIVFENNIIDSQKLFEIFRHQQDYSSDFISSCKTLGCWSQDVQLKINACLDELRKPLGHILVSRGWIDLKKLTHMLDEFLSQLNIQVPKTESLAVQIKTPEVPAPASVLVAASPLDDLLETIQPGILSELDEIFDEKKKKMVRVALSLIKDNLESDPNVCKKLFSDIVKILTSLNDQLAMLALEKITELFSAMIGTISKINAGQGTLSKEKLSQSTAELTKAIDLAWTLKQSILAEATERSFFSDQVQRQAFDTQISSLKGLL
jgi:nucleoside diphosphate kinase